jgi:hypothetical protein
MAHMCKYKRYSFLEAKFREIFNFAVTCMDSIPRHLFSCSSPHYYFYFFIIIISGVRPNRVGTAATTGLLYQSQMTDDGDFGEIGGMKIGRGNRSTRRKPAPLPLCQPQIPHG